MRFIMVWVNSFYMETNRDKNNSVLTRTPMIITREQNTLYLQVTAQDLVKAFNDLPVEAFFERTPIRLYSAPAHSLLECVHHTTTTQGTIEAIINRDQFLQAATALSTATKALPLKATSDCYDVRVYTDTRTWGDSIQRNLFLNYFAGDTEDVPNTRELPVYSK